jgi:hypothetical protein
MRQLADLAFGCALLPSGKNSENQKLLFCEVPQEIDPEDLPASSESRTRHPKN